MDMRRVPTIYRRPFSGHYFQLDARVGKPFRSRSLWDEYLEVSKAGITSDLEGPMGQSLLVLSRSFVVHGRHVLLSVAEDISRQRALAQLFQHRLLLLSLVALLLLLGMQMWVVRRSLRPLARMKDELGRLERGETAVLQQQVPSEIAPLVDEVNRLLSVLRQRLTRSRNAMGNLAHALKTPLTRMVQILEQQPATSDRRQLSELVQQIERRIEKEMSRARMAGRVPGDVWPEPARDVRDLVASLETVHQRHGIVDLEIQEGLHIVADREDVMELLGNLLDNAYKWATSRIVLRLAADDGLRILVEDDGPGLDEKKRQDVLRRGTRMDESKHGHGLGLAIVREIVAVYHGSLELGRSSLLGGLRVYVHLPAASLQA
jgi:signal transduction histidine kinase